MPCRDDRDDAWFASQLQQRNDKLAQMLCWLCGTVELEAGLALITANPTLYDWWKEHQASDETRVLHEMNQEIHRFKSSSALATHFISKAEKVHQVSNFHKDWFVRLAERAYNQYVKLQKEFNKEQKLKKEALAKLTPEERKALGLRTGMN